MTDLPAVGTSPGGPLALSGGAMQILWAGEATMRWL